MSATTTANLDIVRRLMDEVWAAGRLQLIPELVADDYVGHLPIGDHYVPEGLRIDIAAHRAAFPDLTLRIDDLFASGDRVVRRYTLRGTLARPLPGRTATGKEPVTLRQIAIDRLADGRLLESWIVGIVSRRQDTAPGTAVRRDDRHRLNAPRRTFGTARMTVPGRGFVAAVSLHRSTSSERDAALRRRDGGHRSLPYDGVDRSGRRRASDHASVAPKRA